MFEHMGLGGEAHASQVARSAPDYFGRHPAGVMSGPRHPLTGRSSRGRNERFVASVGGRTGGRVRTANLRRR